MTEPGRLTRMDEYPRHQVGGTFDSVVSDSVHWNDGFYFTLGDEASGATYYEGCLVEAIGNVGRDEPGSPS